MGKTVSRNSIGTWMRKSAELVMSVHRKQGLFSSVHVDDIKIAGKRQNMALMWSVSHFAHFIQCTCIGSRCLSDSVCLSKNIPSAHLSSSTTPPTPLTGIRLNPCATPYTGYEPKFCIDVSSEHTPINFPSDKNRENDVSIAASEDFDFPQHSGASSGRHAVPRSTVLFQPCRN